MPQRKGQVGVVLKVLPYIIAILLVALVLGYLFLVHFGGWAWIMDSIGMGGSALLGALGNVPWPDADFGGLGGLLNGDDNGNGDGPECPYEFGWTELSVTIGRTGSAYLTFCGEDIDPASVGVTDFDADASHDDFDLEVTEVVEVDETTISLQVREEDNDDIGNDDVTIEIVGAIYSTGGYAVGPGESCTVANGDSTTCDVEGELQ